MRLPSGFIPIFSVNAMSRRPLGLDVTHVRFTLDGVQRANVRLAPPTTISSGFAFDSRNGEIVVTNRKPAFRVRILHDVMTFTPPATTTSTPGAEQINSATFTKDPIPSSGSYTYKANIRVTVEPA